MGWKSCGPEPMYVALSQGASVRLHPLGCTCRKCRRNAARRQRG